MARSTWALFGDGPLAVALQELGPSTASLLVASFGGDTYGGIGSRPELPGIGFAGTWGVRLGRDVEVDLDLADPEIGRLVIDDVEALLLDEPQFLRWWPVLEAVIGVERAEQAGEAWRRAWPTDHVDLLGPVGRARIDRDLQRLVLAEATAEDPDVGGFAALVAAVEAAAAATELGELVPDRAARSRLALTALAEPILRGPLEEIPDLPDRKDAFELSSLVRTAAEASFGLGDLGADLAEALQVGASPPADDGLAADLDYARHPAAAPMPAPALAKKSMAAAEMEAGAPAGGAARRALRIVRAVGVDADLLPPELAAAAAGVVRSDAEVEVVIDGGAAACEGWWARASGPDGTPLALAPLRPGGPDGRDAVALLLCPPAAVAAPDLVVDCTPSPALPPRSAAARAADRAVRMGRAAARAHRAGHPNAAHLLHTTAALWEQVGMPVAARGAEQAAQGRTLPGPRLLSDRLAAAQRGFA